MGLSVYLHIRIIVQLCVYKRNIAFCLLVSCISSIMVYSLHVYVQL